MLLGNTEITKEMLPSFSWQRDDPDFIYQSMQDIFQKNKQQIMPIQGQQMTSTENNTSSWNMGGMR